MRQARNVLGEQLETENACAHVVCVELTEKFIASSARRGNDLRTLIPALAFPELEPGNRWCYVYRIGRRHNVEGAARGA
jgi:uncharacterized protein (DUF2237 family)